VDEVARLAGVSPGCPEADLTMQWTLLDDLVQTWMWGSRRTSQALLEAHDATARGDEPGAAQILEAAEQRIAIPFYVRVLDASLRQIFDE
ncbi:MAG TPA: hypothetical protein VK509_02385, partial [Polyangiales bacterium]|nr:hypothetical protein [Polyangiales bacterium]